MLSRTRRRLPRLLVALSVLVAGLMAGVEPAAAQTEPFRDPDLPLDARIDDLLGRLTLGEKVSLLHQQQPAIPRLGIGAFRTGTEALHGVAWLGEATVFPQAVGLASTWDPELVERVGAAVGREARGFHRRDPAAHGLNVWAPVVNLLRDPRWGRNEEGYSEDPHLTAAIATAYAGGLRGDHPTYLQTAPTLKHYLANNNEVRRDTTSAVLPPRLLHDYEYPAYAGPIAAGAATGVMTSYNLLNGRPATVEPSLDAVVRPWSDEDLMVVSDAFAPGNLVGSQAYYATQAEANAATLKAGVDSFTQDGADPTATLAAIHTALDQGLLTEADVNEAVRHILSIRFRLGEFDAGDRNPYAAITPDVIDSPEHRALALEAAKAQLVLLKNDRGTLPLDPATTDEIAVVGPLADTLYHDWYSGTMPYQVTPLDGVTARLGADAEVAASEGVDRIALREVTTGRYLAATGTGDADPVRLADTGADDPAAQFDVADWGEATVTLRSAANGRYVGYNWGPFVTRDTQPNGWFTQQQFSLEEQADGTVAIRYTGYETREGWFGPDQYVTVADDGTMALTAATADEAARFAREVVRDGVAEAVAAATGADAAVVVVGSMPLINGRETDDRATLALAPRQAELVRAVREANPNTVVVLENSYPTSITWEQRHVPAILWSTHAGQETGNAVASALFGDHDPAGRLTQTWYRSDADLPDIGDYDIARTGMTYLYHRGTPLYPFGHGLGYTTFRYANLRLSAGSVSADGRVTVSVDVTNTGRRAGTETVQLYTHQRQSRVQQPVRQLRDFARVTLEPGRTRRVSFDLSAADLAFWDVTRGRRVVERATHDIYVAASATDVREAATLRVRGETIPPRDLGATTAAWTFDDYAGTTLVDTSKERGTAVAATAAGQWVAFDDVALRRGADRIEARVATPGDEPAAIEVRLGHPRTGRLLGTIQVPATGDRYAWTTVSAGLADARGRGDVYLVFTAPAALDHVTVS